MEHQHSQPTNAPTVLLAKMPSQDFLDVAIFGVVVRHYIEELSAFFVTVNAVTSHLYVTMNVNKFVWFANKY